MTTTTMKMATETTTIIIYSNCLFLVTRVATLNPQNIFLSSCFLRPLYHIYTHDENDENEVIFFFLFTKYLKNKKLNMSEILLVDRTGYLRLT
jgi:hypothetical protein